MAAALPHGLHNPCMQAAGRYDAASLPCCQVHAAQPKRRKWWRPSPCSAHLCGPGTQPGRQAAAAVLVKALQAPDTNLSVLQAEQLLQEHGQHSWSDLTDVLVAYGLQLPTGVMPTLCTAVLSMLHQGTGSSGSAVSPFRRYPVLVSPGQHAREGSSPRPQYSNSSVSECHWDHDQDMLASASATGEPAHAVGVQTQPSDPHSSPAHSLPHTEASWSGRGAAHTPGHAIRLLAHVFTHHAASATPSHAALMALTLVDASISSSRPGRSRHRATPATHATPTPWADSTVQETALQLAQRAVLQHVISVAPKATTQGHGAAAPPTAAHADAHVTHMFTAAGLAVACLQSCSSFGRPFLNRGILHTRLNQRPTEPPPASTSELTAADMQAPQGPDGLAAASPITSGLQQQQPGDAFWAAFRSGTQSVLHSAHPSELVAWLWAHAACGQDVCATQEFHRWLESVAAAIHVDQLTNHQLLDLACALAVLSPAPPTTTTAAPVQGSQDDGTEKHGPEPGLFDGTTAAQHTSSPDEFNTEHSSRMIADSSTSPAHLLVLHPTTPHPALEPALHALITSRTPLSPGQLVDFLEVCAKARLRLSQPCLSKVHSLLAAALPWCTATQLAQAAAALAKMKTALPAPVLRQLLHYFAEHIANQQPASIADVAALVWALPHVSRSYTRWLLQEQRSFLGSLAAYTMPALAAVSPADQPSKSSHKRTSGGLRPRAAAGLAARRGQLRRTGAQGNANGNTLPPDSSDQQQAEEEEEAEAEDQVADGAAGARVVEAALSEAASGAAWPSDGQLATPSLLVAPAQPSELVQLVVGFTRLGYYPGALWMRAHRQACITLQSSFSPDNRQRLRNAYRTLLLL